eukprot:TRINITY_DN9450_c0_g1_i1.p1 TRINITY_DN9450_c0_g1~~TRINITY_DN9450_c0_g1_i1.p1  ORF type:complete len:120 (+),score=39.36 TRINITY_DN9450_c0_g1_i1:82-441(+)
MPVLIPDGDAYDCRVCGQARGLVQHLRAVVEQDAAAVEAALENLQRQIAAKAGRAGSVCVTLGYPLRDIACVGPRDAGVVVKFVMDPLDVDCKQRTFVAAALAPAADLFEALYKFICTS